MAQAGVPTAAWEAVTTAGGRARRDRAARRGRPRGGYPVVLKADGLAAGKGVVIAADEAEARTALEMLLVEHRFDTTSRHRRGMPRRASSFRCSRCATASAPCRWLRPATSSGSSTATAGPNTGGMGSFSPVAGFDAARAQDLTSRFHQPILDLMARRRHALPRGALRRPDADAGRSPPARAQRPLRGPRDAGRAAAPAQRPARSAEPGRAARRARRGRARLVAGSRRHRRACERRLPGAPRGGDRIDGLGAVAADVEVNHAGVRRGGRRIS